MENTFFYKLLWFFFLFKTQQSVCSSLLSTYHNTVVVLLRFSGRRRRKPLCHHVNSICSNPNSVQDTHNVDRLSTRPSSCDIVSLLMAHNTHRKVGLRWIASARVIDVRPCCWRSYADREWWRVGIFDKEEATIEGSHHAIQVSSRKTVMKWDQIEEWNSQFGQDKETDRQVSRLMR
jgi:hypothetical protein